MPFHIIVGSQWGDEGKGRIVDLFSARAEYVARYSGGDNAGHTVTVGSQIFKLHLIPSGIVHPHTTCLLGNGMVVNVQTLLKEVETLQAAGVQITPERLVLSQDAQLITPFHRLLDQAQEEARLEGKLGTTGRGIGPAYVDKVARQGLRAREMRDLTALRARLVQAGEELNRLFVNLFGRAPVDTAPLVEEYVLAAQKAAPYVGDCAALARQALDRGETLVAEGAQGTLLDIEHGTYPFVTSSTTLAPGAFAGLGLGIRPVERVVGVTKAFQTRVGSGPFPTELSGALAARLRGTGANPWDEYGTTTGRPRRVGWLDGVLLRYAAALNGLNEMVITKLDVLSGLEKLNLCTAYRCAGQLCELPVQGVHAEALAACEPCYEELPGWDADLGSIRKWADLPACARTYVERIEEISGVPVSMISVGPERDQVVIR